MAPPRRPRDLVVPATVTICRRRWRVVDESDLSEAWAERMEGKTMADHGVVGMAHPVEREIHLSRGIASGNAERPRTFLHELLHAILAEADVRLPCDYEEIAVTAPERPLYEVLRRLEWR